MTGEFEPIRDDKGKIELALVLARDGLTDGGHHKQWVIDQMVRALTGEDYDKWLADTQGGCNGPNTYEWEVGIAP